MVLLVACSSSSGIDPGVITAICAEVTSVETRGAIVEQMRFQVDRAVAADRSLDREQVVAAVEAQCLDAHLADVTPDAGPVLTALADAGIACDQPVTVDGACTVEGETLVTSEWTDRGVASLTAAMALDEGYAGRYVLGDGWSVLAASPELALRVHEAIGGTVIHEVSDLD